MCALGTATESWKGPASLVAQSEIPCTRTYFMCRTAFHETSDSLAFVRSIISWTLACQTPRLYTRCAFADEESPDVVHHVAQYASRAAWCSKICRHAVRVAFSMLSPHPSFQKRGALNMDLTT